MGFNLGAFVGGASRSISENIERETEYELKMKQIAETEAMRQRAARSGARKKEQAQLEEDIRSLKFMNLTDQQAASIARQGRFAVESTKEWAMEAIRQGKDPSAFFVLAGSEDAGEMSNEITDTINASAKANNVPKIGTGVMGDYTADYVKISELAPKPKKVESSYAATLTRISNDIMSTDDPAEIEKLRSRQEQVLEDLRMMKEAERKTEGTTTPTFDLGAITANVNEIRRGQLTRFGFEVGIDGTVENITEGNQYKSDLAELAVANQLNTRNKGVKDPNMQLAAEGIRESAIINLNDYASQVAKNKPERVKEAPTPEAFSTLLKQGEYRQGDVINVGGKLVLYTGIPDYRTGMPFIPLTSDVDM